MVKPKCWSPSILVNYAIFAGSKYLRLLVRMLFIANEDSLFCIRGFVPCSLSHGSPVWTSNQHTKENRSLSGPWLGLDVRLQFMYWAWQS